MEQTARYNQVRRITLLGSAKNAGLSVLKILVGFIGHSHALVADGVHSLSDLLIDALVLVASRFGSKMADSDHPYGHGRIETAATVLLAFLMSLAGIGIMIDAGWEVFGLRTSIRPDIFVLFVALFSVIANEVLYFYTRNIGEKVGSKLLQANAWHHRSDSASSLVVLVGATGAILGFPLLDPIAAIIVGVMIVKMAWQFGWHSIRELVDTGLEEDMLETIKQTIIAVPGVRAIHQLRTRSVAGAVFLDVHIMVDPFISVSEGHFIGQQVHFNLLKLPGITDVTLHVDPENDEIVPPSRDLVAREEVIKLLKEYWQNLIPATAIEAVTLHYLGGKIYIELKLPMGLLAQANLPELNQQLRQNVVGKQEIAGIEILFK